MRRDYKILIIDDDGARREQLKIIMDFVGEECICTGTQDWQNNTLEPEALLTVMIGQCDTPFTDLIAALDAWSTVTPLLFLQDVPDQKGLSTAARRRTVGCVTLPLTYSHALEMLHRCQMYQENCQHVNNAGKNRPVPLFRSMVGTSAAVRKIRHLIQQVADTGANVLILGESGTGKEVAARNIHAQSSRNDKSFVPINCGAIPAELLESELFGHEKGAFTGAISSRKGRFELAHGGTIFLDEIGDMPLPMQVKLLRVLQERCFERVGSNKTVEVDVRIISATHRDLEHEIKQGTFREDLYYRLNVFPIRMASMRNRVEDIPLLLNELIARIEGEGRGTVRLMPETVRTLCQYHWPGNVRELANLIERLAILFPNGIVEVNDLPRRFRSGEATPENALPEHAAVINDLTTLTPSLPAQGIDLKEHLVKTELALITQALEESNWVVARAANYLNMRRTTLVEKMRKYEITRPEGIKT